MGYHKANGGYADTQDLTLFASASRTATVTGTAHETGDRRVARLKLDVTAASGTTPTLDVDIETSRDGVTWYVSGSFTQATGVTSEEKLFMLDRFVRPKATIGGTTPDFTFSVAGETV